MDPITETNKYDDVLLLLLGIPKKAIGKYSRGPYTIVLRGKAIRLGLK